MKILYLIRGLPGSGKTTLAKDLRALYFAPWFEADMFFEKNGEYKFDKDHIQEAHDWCKKQTLRAMFDDAETVIVSNTFTRQWQLNYYRVIAKECGYQVMEIICKGNFTNTHGVPPETIEKMRGEFEY